MVSLTVVEVVIAVSALINTTLLLDVSMFMVRLTTYQAVPGYVLESSNDR